MRQTDSLLKKGGFTMIEVVAALLIIGIISAVAVTRIMSTSDYDLSSQVEVIKNHLRYAQIRAMNTDSDWGIFFTSTTYYLFQGVYTNPPVLLPGEDNAIVNLTTKKSELRITTLPPGGWVTYDSFGSPGGTTITIGTSGGAITVEKNTGFIP